jgi:hypothetical protein
MSVGNSRYLKIGPGGRKCNCCFPAPGSKDRRAQFRSAKRKAERAAMKEWQDDLRNEIFFHLQLTEEAWEGYDPWWDDHYEYEDFYEDDWHKADDYLPDQLYVDDY